MSSRVLHYSPFRQIDTSNSDNPARYVFMFPRRYLSIISLNVNDDDDSCPACEWLTRVIVIIRLGMCSCFGDEFVDN